VTALKAKLARLSTPSSGSPTRFAAAASGSAASKSQTKSALAASTAVRAPVWPGSSGPGGEPAGRPSLDELRDRIARIIARGAVHPPRADPSRGELPFFREETEAGPLYTRRVACPPAARV